MSKKDATQGFSLATKHSNRMEKLGWTERFGFATGDFAYNLIYQPMSAFILLYYTNVVGADAAAAASIIAISKILDAISDVIMGAIIDKTHTKAGQARPWVLRSALPLALSFVLMFSVPHAFGGMARLVWMFITYNMTTTLFYTSGNLSYGTMLNLITGNQAERGLLSTVRLIFAVIAQFAVNAYVLKLVRVAGNGDTYNQAGWTRAALILGAISILLTIFSYLATKERPENSQVKKDAVSGPSPMDSLRSLLKNKYWLIMFFVNILTYSLNALHLGSMAYFAQYNLENVDHYSILSNCIQSIQLLGLIVIAPIIMQKFGKHVTFQLGTALTFAGFVISLLAGTGFAGNCAANIIKGLGFSCTSSMIYALIADTIDYGEWTTGVKCAGMGNAAAGFGTKIGGAIGTWVWGLILSAGGFSAEASSQSAAALLAIRLTYVWIPGILCAMIFIVMCFYHLDKEYDALAKNHAAGSKS